MSVFSLSLLVWEGGKAPHLTYCWNLSIQHGSRFECFTHSNSEASTRTSKCDNWSILIDHARFMLIYIVDPLLKQVHFQATETPRQRWKLAPTRREQDKWDRATKAATAGSVSPLLSLSLMFVFIKIDTYEHSLRSPYHNSPLSTFFEQNKNLVNLVLPRYFWRSWFWCRVLNFWIISYCRIWGFVRQDNLEGTQQF